jgi:hypothetical protein
MKYVKWCACALVLLAPGSFVVLPAVWLISRIRPRPVSR